MPPGHFNLDLFKDRLSDAIIRQGLKLGFKPEFAKLKQEYPPAGVLLRFLQAGKKLRTVILIDDLDVPLFAAAAQQESLRQTANLLTALLSVVKNSMQYIRCGMLTARSYFSDDHTSGTAGWFRCLFDEYDNKLCGFTRAEVTALGLNADELERRCGGYSFALHCTERVCRPASVLHYLGAKEGAGPLQLNAGLLDLTCRVLKDAPWYLTYPGMAESSIQVGSSCDMLLFQLGLLSPADGIPPKGDAVLTAPNLEAERCLEELFLMASVRRA